MTPLSTEDGRERAVAVGLTVIFGAIAVLATLDVIADLGEGTTFRHVAIEASIALAALAGVGWMGVRLKALLGEARALTAQAKALEQHLEVTRQEAAQFRQEARDLIDGLASAIDRQLEKWGLTPSEKDVALLLLKGLSHKEIGALREVSEATVRQQARALYKKAGLGGRHDLAAFFLEDLLGPARPRP